MTALGRAYGFLMECQQMTWRQLEEAVCRPYSCKCCKLSCVQLQLQCIGIEPRPGKMF